MKTRFPPPPNTSEVNMPIWRDWFYKISVALNEAYGVTSNLGQAVQALGATFPMSGMGGEVSEGEIEGITYEIGAGGGRGGVFPGEIRQSIVTRTTTKTMASNTSLQALFSGVSGAPNGALTVEGSTTYFFDVQFSVSNMSGTSGNIGLDILGAGSATITSAAWQALGKDGSTLTNPAACSHIFTPTIGITGDILNAGTGDSVAVYVKGIFRVNAAGTIIPSIQLTTAAAAVIGVNSWFKCHPIGSNTVTTVGNWS